MGTSLYFHIFINILSYGTKKTGLMRIFLILIIPYVVFPYLLGKLSALRQKTFRILSED